MTTSNYNVALNKAFDDLMMFDPDDVAREKKVIYDHDNACFKVPYWNEVYIVNPIDRTVKNETSQQESDILDAILTVHYLSYNNLSAQPSGNWVSLKELPNGGSLFYPAFYKDSLTKLMRVFGNDSLSFLTCCEKMNGSPVDFGDRGYRFQAFPLIPICVAVWEGDDEFAANATILFDPTTSLLMHIESIIGLGDQLAKKLIALNK